MALPFMREGDTVITAKYNWLPLPWLHWQESGRGIVAVHALNEHISEGWCRATQRVPVRHKLMDTFPIAVVVAPDVVCEEKQWDKWEELRPLLPNAIWIDESFTRDKWLYTLSRARTVICPDTGTAHVADAMGVPKVIVLHGMGKQHYIRYRPFHDSTRCIVRDSMKDITVEDVMEKIYD